MGYPLRRRACTQAHVILVFALAGAALLAAASFTLWYSRQDWRDLAAEAKQYLLDRNVKPLTGDVDALLANPKSASVPTLEHPLLGEPAPDFELTDHTGQKQKLSEHIARGPVVLVFYYGYYCNHCVSQLFALSDDLSKFHELGAEVVAVSPDSAEETANKFAKYGPFTFPVIADPGNKIAAAYSVYAPRTATTKEALLHGTFIIDKDGIVRWCNYSRAPFTDNATLLVELAKPGDSEPKR